MTDLYIATPTQADYDALMRLAEAAGYKWMDGELPTEYDTWKYVEEETIVHLYDDFQEGRRMAQDDRAFYESQNATIETIPNLADIKAIWKVQPDDHKAFFKGKSYKHPLPSDESVIMLEMTDELVEGLMDIHKALAVEYKPKESEDIMPEKVKLPKFMCEWLSDIALMEDYPLGAILESEKLRYGNREVLMWSTGNTANQWKLIDALRYGYEAEPEPRWGIKAGNCYMDNKIRWQFDRVTPDFIIDDELAYFTNKDKADDMVKTLGFGEVVDLNKEGKVDD